MVLIKVEDSYLLYLCLLQMEKCADNGIWSAAASFSSLGFHCHRQLAHGSSQTTHTPKRYGKEWEKRQRSRKAPTWPILSWADVNTIQGWIAGSCFRSPSGLLRLEGKSLLYLKKKKTKTEETQLLPLHRFYFDLFALWNQISSSPTTTSSQVHP